MALDFQKMEIVFKGLNQHTNPRTQIPGALRACSNVVFTKEGRIDKRRAYRVVSVAGTTHDEDVENFFCNATTFRDQLVLISHDYLYSLVDTNRNVFFADLTLRGPSLRGNVHVTSITTQSHTEDRP